MHTVSYDELESALAAAELPFGAAEAHGLLCGALAATQAFRPQEWIDDLLAGSAAPERQQYAREVLAALCRESAVDLGGAEFEFAPLLPEEDAPLDARTEALAAWSSGFLSGIGGVPMPAAGWPEAVREFIADLAEIAKAEVGADDSSEVNESAYTEVVEFLRAGVQLVVEELGTDLRTEAGDHEHSEDADERE